MSEFIDNFSGLLASVPREAAIAKAWERLLPLVCSYAGDNCHSAGLWLLDSNFGDPTLTLWHWWSKFAAANTPPEYVSISLQGVKQVNLYGLVQNCLEKLPTPGHVSNINFSIAQILVPEESATEKSELMGAITLFSNNDSLLEQKFLDELEIACRLVGTWMKLNREWRKSSAITEFYSSQTKGSDETSLAECTIKKLQKYASSRLATAIYVPDGVTLRRISYSSKLSMVPTQPTDDSIVSKYHFSLLENRHKDEEVFSFDSSGNILEQPSQSSGICLADFPEIAHVKKPVTVMLARIRDQNRLRPNDQAPPIATVLMATSAEPGFIGGRFSDTNRSVLRLIMTSFRDSYFLALQRDRLSKITAQINTHATSRAKINVMSESGDKADFAIFAKMAKRLLPSVVEAAVVSQTASNSREHIWRSNDNIATTDWLEHTNEPNAFFHKSKIPCKIIRRTIEKIENNSTNLYFYCLISTNSLSHIEETLLDRIIAEAKIEHHLHINKGDWAQQLAEVRHNMRAVLGSVIGKAELLSQRYEAAIVRRDPAVVFERLVNQGEFRKNLRMLTLAGKELEAIFENIRALVGQLDDQVLQIKTFDIHELVLSTMSILEIEAKRRGLEFIFLNRLSLDLRRITADAIWTRIALFNLLENAIKYSDRDSQIDVVLEHRGSHWQLRVTNIGRYIPPEMKDKIFQPYQRVKVPGIQVMPGTGLGLMTVKKYVELHQHVDVPVPGGGPPIQVESTPLDQKPNTSAVTRAKTVFTISIPRRGPSHES